jgi:mRNA interferase MazF
MKGDVVTVLFPFSDLGIAKARPALILIDLPGDDVVVAAITSGGNDPNGVTLAEGDFERGKLNHLSFVRPSKLFTIQKTLIGKVIGKVTEAKRLEVVARLNKLLS